MNKQRRAISIVSITLALIIMTTLMIGTIAFAAPTSDMLVMDNADMLTNEDEAKIENALYQIYEQTNIEYAIYLAPSLDGKTIEEASLEAGRKLGIGDKEDNTGLLIYVALADREFRMEVGYGLEGVIPDSQAKRIIDCMTSYFKNENYADGLLAAVTKTVEILNDSGEYTISQDENYVVETDTDDDDLLVGMIVVIVFIVVLCVASAFVDGGSGSSLSGHYYSSGYSSSSSSSGSFGGGSFGGGGASGGW
mgnify:FL=1